MRAMPIGTGVTPQEKTQVQTQLNNKKNSNPTFGTMQFIFEDSFVNLVEKVSAKDSEAANKTLKRLKMYKQRFDKFSDDKVTFSEDSVHELKAAVKIDDAGHSPLIVEDVEFTGKGLIGALQRFRTVSPKMKELKKEFMTLCREKGVNLSISRNVYQRIENAPSTGSEVIRNVNILSAVKGKERGIFNMYVDTNKPTMFPPVLEVVDSINKSNKKTFDCLCADEKEFQNAIEETLDGFEQARLEKYPVNIRKFLIDTFGESSLASK